MSLNFKPNKKNEQKKGADGVCNYSWIIHVLKTIKNFYMYNNFFQRALVKWAQSYVNNHGMCLP